MPSRLSTTDPKGGFPESSFKYSPLQHVRTLFVGFVQGLFGAAPLGAYHWSPEDETSEIYISDESPVRDVAVGKRPAVSFTRGPISFHSLGLDDLDKYDFATHMKQKSVLVPGTMSVNCSSRNDIESEQIAWVIAEHIWLLRDMLMRVGFFEIGRQQMVGAPSKPGDIITGDSSEEWFTTVVVCPFQFNRTSRFTPLGLQILQNIEFSLQARTPPAMGMGAITQPGADLPTAVCKDQPESFAPNASDSRGGMPNAADPAAELPIVPHPLNPSQLVRVRVVRGARVGAQVTAPNGVAPIPIPEPCVEQSPQHVTDTLTFKV